MSYPNAVIIASELRTRQTLSGLLSRLGMTTVGASTVGEAQAILAWLAASVIFSAEELADGSFADVLRLSREERRRVPVIVFSPQADWKGYMRILRAGAFDCVRYPSAYGEIERVTHNALSYEWPEEPERAAPAA